MTLKHQWKGMLIYQECFRLVNETVIFSVKNGQYPKVEGGMFYPIAKAPALLLY